MLEDQFEVINKALERIGTRLEKIEEKQANGQTGLHQPWQVQSGQPDYHFATYANSATHPFSFSSHNKSQVEGSQGDFTHDNEDEDDAQNKVSDQEASSSAAPGLSQRPIHPGISPYHFSSYIPVGPHMPAPIQVQPHTTGGLIPQLQPVYLVEPRVSVPAVDYKSRYESIKSSMTRTVLDDEWLAPESRSGIASADHELAVILSRNGKFVETELKLMKELQLNYGDESRVAEILDQLHLSQKTHMRYIQEEYNSLQLGGQYGNQAKTIFKQIRRNTTVYTPAFVDDIKTALSVAGMRPAQQHHHPQFFGGHRGSRFQAGHGNPYFRPFRKPNPQHYQQKFVPTNRNEDNGM